MIVRKSDECLSAVAIEMTSHEFFALQGLLDKIYFYIDHDADSSIIERVRLSDSQVSLIYTLTALTHPDVLKYQ